VRKSLGLVVFVTLVGCVALSDAAHARDYDWMSRDQKYFGPGGFTIPGLLA
jgi:hypothetical protein